MDPHPGGFFRGSCAPLIAEGGSVGGGRGPLRRGASELRSAVALCHPGLTTSR